MTAFPVRHARAAGRGRRPRPARRLARRRAGRRRPRRSAAGTSTRPPATPPPRAGCTITQELAGVVVLAVPLPAMATALDGLTIDPDATITDLGSVKRAGRGAARRRRSAAASSAATRCAAPSAPGHTAVDPALFTGARWALCLEPGTELPRWLRVAEVALAVGAEVVPVTAAEHDDAVAAISHVPHLLAAALAAAAADAGPLALALAAGSFRDGTRVIGSDPAFVTAMVEGNAGPTAEALARVEAQLDRPWPELVAAGHAVVTRQPGRRDRPGAAGAGRPARPGPGRRRGHPAAGRVRRGLGARGRVTLGLFRAAAQGRLSAWTRTTSSAASTRSSTRSTSCARPASTPTSSAPASASSRRTWTSAGTCCASGGPSGSTTRTRTRPQAAARVDGGGLPAVGRSDTPARSAANPSTLYAAGSGEPRHPRVEHQRASMGRHADPTAPRRRPAPVVLIAAGVVAVLLAGGLVWWLAGSGEDCDTRQTVAVTVAPELGDVTEKLLADPIALDDGVCAVARGDRAGAAADRRRPRRARRRRAARRLGARLLALGRPRRRRPAGGRRLDGLLARRARDQPRGRRRAGLDRRSPPSWGQALATGRPLAVPDLATSAEGLAALAAVRSSLGGGEDADNAVVQAVLAAGAGDADRAGRRAGRRRRRVAPTPRWCRSASRRCSATNQDADGPRARRGLPERGLPVPRLPGAARGRARPATHARRPTPSSGR